MGAERDDSTEDAVGARSSLERLADAEAELGRAGDELGRMGAELTELAVRVEAARMEAAAARGELEAAERGGPAEAEAATTPPAGSDADGARLVAFSMALEGTPREEAARRLADEFGLADSEALLDEIYARASA